MDHTKFIIYDLEHLYPVAISNQMPTASQIAAPYTTNWPQDEGGVAIVITDYGQIDTDEPQDIHIAKVIAVPDSFWNNPDYELVTSTSEHPDSMEDYVNAMLDDLRQQMQDKPLMTNGVPLSVTDRPMGRLMQVTALRFEKATEANA